MPRTAASVLLLVLPGGVPAAHAQSRVGIVTTLQGPATVARARVPTPESLKFRDDVFLYDRIATGENAFARILLGGKALVTMRERSALHLSERPGTSTVELGEGNIGVAVVKEKMKQKEVVEIRTPNAVAAIRGTVVIAEHRQDISSFTAIRGIVDVMRLDPVTHQVTGPPVRLHPLQRIEVHGTAPLRPQPISQEALRRIGGDFKITLDEQATSSALVPSGPPLLPAGAGGPGAGGVGAGNTGGGNTGTGSVGAGSLGGANTGSGSGGSGISGSGLSGSSGRGPTPTPLPVTPLPSAPGPGISGGDRSGPGNSGDSISRDSGSRGSGSGSGGGGRGKR